MKPLKFSQFIKDVPRIEQNLATIETDTNKHYKSIQRIGKHVGKLSIISLKQRNIINQQIVKAKRIKKRKREHLMWWE